MLRLRYIIEDTPDAPLLLLYGDDREVFARIVECMLRLSTLDIARMKMTDIRGVTSVDGTDVTMMIGRSDEGACSNSQGGIDWTLTARSWDDLAELLSSFAEEDQTGRTRHQRLVPQLRMPASSIPVIVTTSVKGEW